MISNLLLLANVIILSISLLLDRLRRKHPSFGTLSDPYLYYNLIMIVSALQLYYLTKLDFPILSAFDAEAGLIALTAINAMTSVGVLWLSSTLSPPHQAPTKDMGDGVGVRPALIVGLGLPVLIILYVVATVGLPGLMRILTIRSSTIPEMKLLAFGSYMLFPCAAFIAARAKNSRTVVSTLLGLVAIAYFLNARGAILSILVCLYAHFSFRGKLKLGYLGGVASVVVLLPIFLYIGYLGRFKDQYSTFDQFLTAKGGIFQEIFTGEQVGVGVAFARVYSSDIRLPFPGYTIVTAAEIPTPRLLVGEKHAPASSFATERLAPTRWYLTRSEITITGMGNMVMEYGRFLGCAMFSLIMAYVIYVGRKSNARLQDFRDRFLTILTIMITLTALRADMYHAARIAIYSASFVALVLLLSKLSLQPQLDHRFRDSKH